VSILTHAELAGLGASEGAAITWTIPADLPQTLRGLSRGGQRYGTVVRPLNSPTAPAAGNDGASWWVLSIVLGLAILLVSRLKSNEKS
jgi:hypothetical protein